MNDSSNAGAGDRAESVRTFDWSKTPLGPIEHWPQPLRDAVATATADSASVAATAARPGEEHLRELAALAPAGVFLTDAAGKCRYVNARWCEMTGSSAEAARGDGWMDGLHPEDRRLVAENWQQMVRTQGRWSLEYRIQDRAGRVTWVYGLAAPLRDAAGRIDGYIGINTDITERKLAQQALQRTNEALARNVEERSAALRSSEQRYRDLVEQAVDGIFVTDLTGRCLDANSSGTAMFGYALEELREMSFSDLICPADLARIPVEFAHLATGGAVTSQWQLRRKDGSTFPGEIVAQRFPGGRLLAILRDLTARKQAEDALRRSEQINRRTLQALPAHVAVIDRDGRIIATNRAWDQFAASNDAAGNPAVTAGANYLDACRRAAKADDESAVQALVGIEAVMSGALAQFTMEYACHSPREQRWFQMSAVPLGEVEESGAVVTHLNITQRRSAEEALRESEARFRKLFESVATGIAISDPQGRFEQSNPAYESLVGYSARELHGTDFARLVHPDDRAANVAAFRRLLAGEIGHFEIENRLVRKDGSLRWVRKFVSVLPDEPDKPLRFVALVTDVTERKRAEDALREVNATLEQRVSERTAALKTSEERQRAILETVADAIVTIDEHGTIVSANPAAERIFGYRAAELRGQSATLLMPAPYHERHARYLEEYRRAGDIGQMIGTRREMLARRKDGTVFPIEFAMSKVQRLGFYTSVIRDLTDRKRLEADVLEIGEGERLRLAAELHDGVCQELAGIAFKVGAAIEGRKQITAALASELRGIAESITQAALHARQVAHAMSPVISGGDGLMLALQQLAATTARRYGVQCLYRCPTPVPLPQPTVALQLYRVAQEAIRNAIQHGEAKRITVRLSRTEDAVVCLEIVDSGTGLPASAATAAGMGIRTMRYRVGLIGGQFSIERRKRGGTQVRCLVPQPPITAEAPIYADA